MRKIWYRKGMQRHFWKLPAFQDKGTLSLSSSGLLFAGKRFRADLPYRTITRLIYGRQGVDPLNPWIGVTTHDGGELFFMDGSLLGWAGMFGGTRSIFRTVSALVAGANSRVVVEQRSRLTTTGRVIFLFLLLYLATEVISSLTKVVRVLEKRYG